jgi:zinc transporter ZupT
MQSEAGNINAMRQRLACLLIGSALTLIVALVGLLLSDALSPGRVPPMLAFWGACAAGGLLILGLTLLERRGGTEIGHAGGPEGQGFAS